MLFATCCVFLVVGEIELDLVALAPDFLAAPGEIELDRAVVDDDVVTCGSLFFAGKLDRLLDRRGEEDRDLVFGLLTLSLEDGMECDDDLRFVVFSGMGGNWLSMATGEIEMETLLFSPLARGLSPSSRRDGLAFHCCRSSSHFKSISFRSCAIWFWNDLMASRSLSARSRSLRIA
mmetsp:Transcript_27372/g.63537  ORF Transcript_27372/g.63537 Transcript_27372/m.63537 type:complete len:176 (-) Transcript_27372:629-1156(-)